jgi:DNA helicase-2/ATP-dependent DNA helicase PcrA
VVVCPDEDEEGRFIAQEIARLIAEKWEPQEIAVLYRTNLQSRAIEEALREENIPYDMVGGQEFFDRREIKDIIAYLRVCNHSQDEISLLRIVNVPPRGIGDTTMDRLGTCARRMKISIEEAIKRAEEFTELPAGAAHRLSLFQALIERYRSRFESEPAHQVARDLVQEVGFRELAQQSVKSASAGARRVAAIDAFLDSMTRYLQRDSRSSLDSWLRRIALDSREEESGDGPSSVTLTTLHAAKGLEWPVVFLCGAEEDLLPHAGMQGEAPNLPEERRLAYVGITRARQRLYITRAAQRIKRGRMLPRTPSRFLDDLPQSVLEMIDAASILPKSPPKPERSFFSSLREQLRAQPGKDR